MSDGGGVVRNWAWFAGRPWSGMWAFDLLQAARFCRERFPDSAVIVDAQNRFGWPALLAGAAAPDLIPSGTVEIPVATLHDHLRADGEAASPTSPACWNAWTFLNSAPCGRRGRSEYWSKEAIHAN
jgi:hypothetical protein